MSNFDYTLGRWKKRPAWREEVRKASQQFQKGAKNWRQNNNFQASVAEVIAGYQCPRNSIYDIYRDTWFCSRKQYGMDAITSRFARGATWKNWTQYIVDTSHEDQRVTSYLSWEWQPSSCSLATFDAEKFVKALGNRRIFMIGDSLTDQEFHALACTLGTHANFRRSNSRVLGGLKFAVQRYFHKHSQLLKAKDPGGKHSDTWGVPESEFKDLRTDAGGFIRYERADHAFMEYVELQRIHGKGAVKDALKQGLKDILNRGRPGSLRPTDIFLFNTGAHWTYQPDFKKYKSSEVGYFYQHSMKDLTELMKELHATLKELFPGKIMYRVNVPGSKDCKKQTHPIGAPQAPPLPFNWASFGEIDQTIIDAVKPDLVMNTSMNFLRPDGRHIYEGYGGAVDCLHSCLPGPVDMYTTLLYNTLLQLPVK